MNIRLVPIGDIKPNPNNPRIIKDEKFRKLVQSIKDFPEMLNLRPVVVNSEMVVLGGNMRLKACQAAGLTEVPTILASGLTDERQREFIIKDNVGFGEWEWETLANEWDADLLAEWGLDVPEFEKAPADGLTDADDVPEPPAQPVSVLGDLWFLGNHRVLCGDSTSVDAVELLMDGRKADMIYTDPPYGVSYEGGHNQKKRQQIKNDALDGADLTDLFANSLMAAHIVSHDHAAFYVWYASGKSVETFAAFANLPLSLRTVIQWYKVKSGLGAFMAQYIPNCEPCIYAYKTGFSPQWFGPTDEKTVWEMKKEGKNAYHPTQKPVELAERAIGNSSTDEQIILDLFGGSGSTLIACERQHRHARLMELDPKYVDVIVKRWQDFTGKHAIHSVTGKTFNEMSQNRDTTG